MDRIDRRWLAFVAWRRLLRRLLGFLDVRSKRSAFARPQAAKRRRTMASRSLSPNFSPHYGKKPLFMA